MLRILNILILFGKQLTEYVANANMFQIMVLTTVINVMSALKVIIMLEFNTCNENVYYFLFSLFIGFPITCLSLLIH